MSPTRFTLAALLCLAVAVPALADWFPDNPKTKWAQLPDLTPNGIDVNCSAGPGNFVLADDFECTQTGPLTGIHIWGSWLYDDIGGPAEVGFTLSIHADIPANPDGTGFSMPGEMLWARYFEPGDFVAMVWEDGISEGWLDPPQEYIFPADTVCWQYNFTIPEADAFVQQGSLAEPVVYWLDVKAYPLEPVTTFGWKTSLDHWNDDAVFGVGEEPYPGPWAELIYPPQHELAGHSIDLAFALTGPEQQEAFDWGDAPDPTYPTLMATNGANHLIVPGVFMGASIDSEPDGQPDAAATGDDNDGNDDEDGVVFTSQIMPGQPASVDVTVSAPGFIDAWIDFLDNGDWADPGEQILVSVPVVAGLNSLIFSVPAGIAPVSSTFCRFRYSLAGGLPEFGGAPDGEVEDCMVSIDDIVLKWIQEPDLSMNGIDICATPTERDYVLADDFLCTRVGPLTDIDIWASWLADLMPQGYAGNVTFVLGIHADIPAALSSTGYSMPGDLLWWRDFFPGDFTFEPYAEQIEEGWLYPPDGYTFPADWTCWRYHFHIDPHLAFVQEGSTTQPIVYWLSLKAFPDSPETRLGWKTSLDHWNDAAVWGEGLQQDPAFWNELLYPPVDPYPEQRMDLAFAIWEDLITDVPAETIPERTGLRQNVPNPFNPRTEIVCLVPAGGGRMTLDIFDARGRLVRNLIDEVRDEGEFSVFWDGRDAEGADVPAGVYFSRLKGPEGYATVKMTLVR